MQPYELTSIQRNLSRSLYGLRRYLFKVGLRVLPMILAATYTHEPPHYGLKVGLINYAAAHCPKLFLVQAHV